MAVQRVGKLKGGAEWSAACVLWLSGLVGVEIQGGCPHWWWAVEHLRRQSALACNKYSSDALWVVNEYRY